MNAKTWVKVSEANGVLQAANVQEALERAGIPVTILSSEGGLDVLVPTHATNEAQALLNRQPRCGEIYFVPSYPVRLNQNWG